MIRGFYRMLFFVKRKYRVKPAPRHLWSEFDWEEVDEGTGRVFMTSKARSPNYIRRMMKRRKVESVEQLLLTIPDFDPRPNWRHRLDRWYCWLTGATKRENVVTPALRELERRGKIKPKSEVLVRSRGGDRRGAQSTEGWQEGR